MNFIEPKIQHHFGGGVYAKEMHIPANHVLLHHKHKFDHLSVLAQGSIELIVDGKLQVIHAPACLTIAAHLHHGVKSLTDVIWFCIHATDCIDEDEIDKTLTDSHDINQAISIAKTLIEEN